jgi:hypothetical protein
MLVKLIKSTLAALMLTSCQYYSGEFDAEEHVVFEIVKYDDYCIATLYIDGQFTTKVKNKTCKVYLENHRRAGSEEFGR